VIQIVQGNCLDILPTLADNSVDAVITDPPYPHIKRDYGYWTTEEWWELIVEGVTPEVRRILKPTGSAVFILQPNSEHIGQLRGWLWEFMAWVCREWNMVQDAWWFNHTAMPSSGATTHGLLRSSVKALVWRGKPDCYCNQEAVLWEESQVNKMQRLAKRFNNNKIMYYPSGHHVNRATMSAAVEKRGGVTPFNLLPIPNANSQTSSGAYGHGAGTPLALADWWTRYICPPGGVVLDPFCGAGTMGIAAVQNKCSFIGIERKPEYVEITNKRIQAAIDEQNKPQQLEMEMLDGTACVG